MGVLRTVVNLALPFPVVRFRSKKERTARAAERTAKALEQLLKEQQGRRPPNERNDTHELRRSA